jgi:NADPH:quinone reductase-like Zn-dependent oxidoreductase
LPDARVSGVFANPDAATLARLADEVAAGRVETPIRQTYALDRVDEAFAAFAAGTRGKLAVSVS